MLFNSTFDMEMTFHSHANKTHFQKKGYALGLILKVRVFWNAVGAYFANSGTRLCNRPLQWNLYLYRIPGENVTGLAYFPLFLFWYSFVSPIKAKRGGRPYIFTAIKPLKTFYVLP